MQGGNARGRIWSALAVAGLALWPFIYFWPATLGQVIVWPHDGFLYSFPMKVLAARAIDAGELPLWNPYTLSGFPLFGEMQTGVLFPGVWLFILLPPIAAANVQMLLTYSVAAVGTYAYTRRIGCRRFAAVFGAATFAFGGFMVAHIGHIAMPQGAAMLPWLLWALDALRGGLRLRWVIAGAVALTLALCAGYPPGPMYLLLVAGLYTVTVALTDPPRPGAVRYLATCAGVVVLGILLASAQLVPAVELGQQSLRASMSYEGFIEFSLPARQLPMLLFPFLFGGRPPIPYWGAWNVWELSGYVGVAPWMLAIGALSLVRRHRIAAFWAALAAFALLLVLGDATPMARIMYQVPGYNLFRAQGRNMFELDFALAILAALALTAASRRALIIGAASTAALVLVIAASATSVGGRWWTTLATTRQGESVGRQLIAGLTPTNPDVWIPVGLATVTAIALILFARRRSPARILLLLALHLADLGYYGHVLSFSYPDAAWVLAPPWLVEDLDGLGMPPATERVALVGYNAGPPDLRPMLWGVQLVNGYDPFLLTRYAEFAGQMPYWGYIAPATALEQPLFLDLLSARWVVMMHPPGRPPEKRPAASADPQRWTARRVTDRATVLENRRAQPRAWLVGRTLALPTAAVLAAIREGRLADGQPFDPAAVGLVEDGAGAVYGEIGPGDEATVVAFAPNAIEIRTRSDTPAFLIASEIYYPGWQASVDGVAVPIRRTDYVLRGIEVGAGEHRVRMQFAPRSLRVGAAISLLTAGALVVAGLWRWWGRR